MLFLLVRLLSLLPVVASGPTVGICVRGRMGSWVGVQHLGYHGSSSFSGCSRTMAKKIIVAPWQSAASRALRTHNFRRYSRCLHEAFKNTTRG